MALIFSQVARSLGLCLDWFWGWFLRLQESNFCSCLFAALSSVPASEPLLAPVSQFWHDCGACFCIYFSLDVTVCFVPRTQLVGVTVCLVPRTQLVDVTMCLVPRTQLVGVTVCLVPRTQLVDVTMCLVPRTQLVGVTVCFVPRTQLVGVTVLCA